MLQILAIRVHMRTPTFFTGFEDRQGRGPYRQGHVLDIYICKYTYIYVRMCIYVYMYIDTCRVTYVRCKYERINKYINLNICIYVYFTYTYVARHVHLLTCTRISVPPSLPPTEICIRGAAEAPGGGAKPDRDLAKATVGASVLIGIIMVHDTYKIAIVPDTWNAP